MFAMQFVARRLVCRAAFLGLCLLPTSLVIGHIVMRSLPSYVTACELRLARQLGLSIDIDAVTHPKPGITWIEVIRLSDPENGATLATVDRVEIAHHGDRLVVNLNKPRIQSRHVERLYRAVHEVLLRLPEADGIPTDLSATELLLLDDEDETQLVLTHVSAGYEPSNRESQLLLTFRVAEWDMRSSVVCRLNRDHQSDPPMTTFDFHTNGSRLPGARFGFDLPVFQRLGSDVTVEAATSGTVFQADGWQGKGSFHLRGVNLDRLISDIFPHRLTGNADVVVNNFVMENGRLVACAGEMSVRDGQISRSLIEAAERSLYLHWKMVPGTETVPEPIPFRTLAFRFKFDRRGFELRGRDGSIPPGAILVSDSVVLHESKYQPLPILGLVRMLVQTSDVSSSLELVPATRETDALLRFLPIPPPVWTPPPGLH